MPCSFLDGWPAWSPDRKRTVVSRGDGVLWLGDDAGEPQRAVANGRSTAWLDNSRFAFIQTDDGMQVEMLQLPDLEQKTLFKMERLVDELPDATDATRVTRVALASHPAMPDRLFVGARIGPRPSAEDTHVFVYNLATDQITELLQVDHPLEPYRSLRFSPDGRWLFRPQRTTTRQRLASAYLQQSDGRHPDLFVRVFAGLSRV